MAKLSTEDAKRIRKLHSEIQFYGTPERGYTDSGLWSFLQYVMTKDSHEKDHDKVVKPLMGDDPDYIKVILLYMLACDTLAVPKSRQMRVSWITTAFSVWHTMTAPYRHTIYQTKKAEDANAMVSEGAKNPAAGRMDFIIQYLPEWMRDPNIDANKGGQGNLVGNLKFTANKTDSNGVPVPWCGSAINAIPQGAHQIRQYTPSLLISDESAFQDEFEASMVAARPAIAGGGKCISVSSVDAGSAFNRMVLESPNGEHPPQQIHPDVARGLDILGMKWPRGLRSWKTASGTWVLEVHYTADPKKDPQREGAAWLAEAVQGYVGGFESTGWKTEMEIDYNAGGGAPVFPYLSFPGHPIFAPEMDWREAVRRFDIFAGYDWGSNNPAAFEIIGVDYTGDLYFLWELYEPCLDLPAHVEKMKASPYWKYIKSIHCDPSITSREHRTAAGTMILGEEFARLGVRLVPGRRGADVPVAHRLNGEYWADPTAPRAFVTAGCPNLAAELKDLRWDKHVSEAVAQRHNAKETIRDKDNHAFDAISYCIDARPRLYAGPAVPKKSGKKTMDDLLKKADLRLREKERRKGGISYFA